MTLIGVPTWTMSSNECRDVLVELSRAQAQVTELEARVLACAEATGAAVETGAASTPAWLAHATRATRLEAHRRTKLAASLDHHPVVRDAMAAGHVLAAQATVICSAVDALPEDPSTRERCEKHLVALAEHHDAKELRILGRRVLEVIDPDAADAHEAALLEREEADAAKATSFTMREGAHGQVHGRFTIPALEGSMLKKALLAIAAPKHQRAVGNTYAFDQPTPHRWGEAFCEYVSRYPVDRVPHAGGVAATVVVTLGLESLLGGVKAARLDTGETISAGAARRLACEAGIVPAVLNSASQVLDLGRRSRFHTEPQRIAIGLEQQHCQHPTCRTPAALCHVHHTTPWVHGGRTTVRDAQLLCPRHHALAHNNPPLRT